MMEVQDLSFSYRCGREILRDISFSAPTGSCLAVLGNNGAGKSTLLKCFSHLLRPRSGKVLVDGEDIAGYRGKQLTAYRRNEIGFVFQFYNLVQNLTAEENVELASQICLNPLPAAQVLREVGLEERLQNFPSQLSGGEQQRVAIARALAKNPKLLLCDEPTGALDYNTGKQILKLLQDTCRRNQMTVIVVTHNQALTAMADRVITVKNGKVAKVKLCDAPLPVEQIEW